MNKPKKETHRPPIYNQDLKAAYKKNHEEGYILNDGKGLSARVSPKGKVRWQYRYKVDGANKRMDLGDYPDIPLSKARTEAQQCREWLAEGCDPKVERDLSRSKTLKPVSVKDGLEYWLVNYAEDNRENASKHRAQFKKHLYPYIGKLPLEKTETRHWVECFERISKGIKGKQRAAPVAAGYVLQNAKQALRFCRVRHYALSRALDDLMILDVGQKQKKRDRVLSNQELVDVLRWVTEDGNFANQYYRDMFRLLIVLGARTREVRLSTWREWDFDEMLWTVPEEHSKNGQKIFRPIPRELQSWLLAIKGDAQKSDPILGKIKKPEAVSQYGRLLWKRFGHDTKWTIHDLRRILATRMSDLGIAPHVVEQLLGHSLGGVMQIYNRSQYLPEKKEALSMWFERLELLLQNSSNVVVLAKAQ